MKIPLTSANVDLIAIVDPRPIFKTGFRETLAHTRKPLEIIEADNCPELERKYAHRAPGIIFISGTGYSDLEIINLASRLSRYNPLCSIVVYDNRKSCDFLLSFFKESIAGYLPENFDARELDMCINSLAKGDRYINSKIAYELINRPRQKQPRKTELSGLEQKVASCLIRGMTTSQIAHTLDRCSSTISTVKSNIYRKTKVNNIIDLARALKKQEASFAAFEGK